METRVLVLEEVFRPYPKRTGGTGVEEGFSVRDASETGARLTNNLLYEYTPEEKSKYLGKLRDRFIWIEWKELRAGFGGVFALKGRISRIEGPDPAEPAPESKRRRGTDREALNAEQRNGTEASEV